MKTIKSLPRLGFYLTLLMSPLATAEPLLNGIAESIELNKERFIAALYTSNPSEDAADVLRNDGERRMELRITADRLSAKALNNMWIEGMAINNPSSALREESESLSTLVNMVRRSVVRGDTLVFDTAPGEGMTVTLNGVQLGNIASDNFFSMALRTWIGSVPLSSEFKKNLLAGGDVDANLRDQFARLSPAPERVAVVEGWLAPAPEAEPEEEEEQVARITPPRPEVEISRPRPEVTLPAAAATVEAASESAGQVASNPNTQSQNAGADDAAAEQTAAAEPEPAEPEPEATEPAQVAQAEPQAPGNSTASTPAPETPPPSPGPEAGFEEEEEEAAFISAEAILDRQLYISNVLRKTWAAVEYPERALRREQEGEIRVTVTVDRDGNLLGTIPVEESRYGILNREAIDSFSRAEPFEPFPATINEEFISFTIPVKFEISR